MSETAPNAERQEQQPVPQPEALITAHTERAPTPAETASEKQHMSQESRTVVAAEAPTKNVVEAFQAQEAAKNVPSIVPESRKTLGKRKLNEVQRKLPAPQRRLSSVIHQPVIRAVSEAAGATVSRPSGLLGGGIVAFVGSSAYLYFTKHVGVPYNYLVFSLLFVGGFALGLALELIVWTLTAARRRAE